MTHYEPKTTHSRGGATGQIMFNLPVDLHAAAKDAASSSGLALSEWLRRLIGSELDRLSEID